MELFYPGHIYDFEFLLRVLPEMENVNEQSCILLIWLYFFEFLYEFTLTYRYPPLHASFSWTPIKINQN